MRRRITIAFALVTVAAVGVTAWLLWPAAEAPRATSASVDRDEAPRRHLDWERWAIDGHREQPAIRSRQDGGVSPRDDRRAYWRDQFRRNVDIAPLGPRAPQIQPDDVLAALGPGRGALRECIENAGGWR